MTLRTFSYKKKESSEKNINKNINFETTTVKKKKRNNFINTLFVTE